MSSVEQSIGIFDSGIGGLTVANAISKLLPNEHLVYFGDTEHMPYGDKSPELIQDFSIKISKYLIEEKKCKAVVIACNTASAVAYNYLKETYHGSIPIINVIDPMVELIVNGNINNLGIIATNGTIESGTYQEKLSRRAPHINVKALATPLLAPMIEDNYIHDKVSYQIIESYLSRPEIQNIESLLLACTHYPLIAEDIDKYYNGKVQLLLSGEPVAQKLYTILVLQNLLNPNQKSRQDEFLVSDLSLSFINTAKRFYRDEIKLQEVNL